MGLGVLIQHGSQVFQPYVHCHTSDFVGGAVSVALSGCFWGFCPPMLIAPFAFKPFLSFKAYSQTEQLWAK